MEIVSLNPNDSTVKVQESKIGYALWVGGMAYSLLC